MRALLGHEGQHIAPYLLYPIGFIAVIIGRAQLFTENTLYPVVLVLDERRHVVETIALMGSSFFASNVFGASVVCPVSGKISCATPRHTLSIDKTWPGSRP